MKAVDITDGVTPIPRPSDVVTEHLASNKSASLGTVRSTPSRSNDTPMIQNEDISMGNGNGGQALNIELDQLLKVSFFNMTSSIINQITGRLCLKMNCGLLSK